MNKLTELPNIGAKLAGLLNQIEIETPEQLVACGSRQTFVRIMIVHDTACINMLYALEAAVLGINKKMLSPDIKKDLLMFFRSLR
ncbi:MAG: TfoX/Sxy family DNA transformation protein [Negativicutes bacterium]|jgi:DNA transformation protein